jgi:RNA polymerase sigma-70 factor (ECF subfamily)
LGLPGRFGYKPTVLSLDVTFMEAERRDLPRLLDEARAGDAEAFGEVCRIYETRLLRQAMSLCGNLELAEDLAQETFVEAWRSLRRYNGRSQFFTWLCAILLNRFRNSLRQKRPWLRGLAGKDDEDFQIEEQISDPQLLPNEIIEFRERALLVRKCIQVLSRKHQQVIYLRFYVDNSIESIAAALGCSKGTVKSRLFHALEKLRTMKILNAQAKTCTIPIERHETV